ncbi:MAG: exonuclease SbcCD subunit D [Oscillibacter sp.]|jgi:exonuclease SbcD|nr:exonuclease SbcCD subunit D [Oscillibacter sp.]
MKLMHLSDLHLGLRLNEFSMLEDQTYILREILTIADREHPDAVLIAGDIYDKAVPPAEAVVLFDEFLSELARRNLAVLMISGNHDSPERIAFGSRLLRHSRVYLAPVYDGRVEPVTLEDAFGPVDFWLLPFLRPAHVRRFYPEEATDTYTQAMACAVGHMAIDPLRRNVLVTHQFVTGATKCESENVTVGGTDNVDAAVFSPFTYTALGHIHSPQNAGGERVRYCGTPLKYSFSEAAQEKSVTMVELGETGGVLVRTIPLTPLRDLLEVRGTYLEVTARSFYEKFDQNAYLHVTLTDEEDIPDAVGKLRSVYPNLMKLDYDNRRTHCGGTITGAENVQSKSPMELFDEFFEAQNGQPMHDEERSFIRRQIETIWEAEV